MLEVEVEFDAEHRDHSNSILPKNMLREDVVAFPVRYKIKMKYKCWYSQAQGILGKLY